MLALTVAPALAFTLALRLALTLTLKQTVAETAQVSELLVTALRLEKSFH